MPSPRRTFKKIDREIMKDVRKSGRVEICPVCERDMIECLSRRLTLSHEDVKNAYIIGFILGGCTLTLTFMLFNGVLL